MVYRIALKCCPILYNPCPQKTCVSNEERIHRLSAIFIMKAIIYNFINTVMKIHAAQRINIPRTL